MATLTPAYGRDYKSAKAAKHDYYSGKDFIFNDASHRNHGAYCSCEDFKDTTIMLRYHRLTRVVTAKYKPQLHDSRYEH